MLVAVIVFFLVQFLSLIWLKTKMIHRMVLIQVYFHRRNLKLFMDFLSNTSREYLKKWKWKNKKMCWNNVFLPLFIFLLALISRQTKSKSVRARHDVINHHNKKIIAHVLFFTFNENCQRQWSRSLLLPIKTTPRHATPLYQIHYSRYLLPTHSTVNKRAQHNHAYTTWSPRINRSIPSIYALHN